MIPTTNVWGTKWFFDIQKLNTESSDVKVKWFWFLSDCSTAEKRMLTIFESINIYYARHAIVSRQWWIKLCAQKN